MEKVFKKNPGLKECYKTADGKCFYQENHAKNHAKNLDDKNVQHITRPAGSDEKESTNLKVVEDPKTADTKLVKGLSKEGLVKFAADELNMTLTMEPTKAQLLAEVLKGIEAKYATDSDNSSKEKDEAIAAVKELDIETLKKYAKDNLELTLEGDDKEEILNQVLNAIEAKFTVIEE